MHKRVVTYTIYHTQNHTIDVSVTPLQTGLRGSKTDNDGQNYKVVFENVNALCVTFSRFLKFRLLFWWPQAKNRSDTKILIIPTVDVISILASQSFWGIRRRKRWYDQDSEEGRMLDNRTILHGTNRESHAYPGKESKTQRKHTTQTLQLSCYDFHFENASSHGLHHRVFLTRTRLISLLL